LTTKVDTIPGSFVAAEQLVQLGQGIKAGYFIDVGVDLLRGRNENALRRLWEAACRAFWPGPG
jgi:hypothetical protein